MQWLARHRVIALGVIFLFWTGLTLIGHAFPRVPFLSAPWSGEQNFQDILRREGRKTAERKDFVFVGIDQDSLAFNQPNDRVLGADEIAGNRALELMAARSYPWSREVWALLLDKLFASGARVVMFDMIFNSP